MVCHSEEAAHVRLLLVGGDDVGFTLMASARRCRRRNSRLGQQLEERGIAENASLEGFEDAVSKLFLPRMTPARTCGDDRARR